MSGRWARRELVDLNETEASKTVPTAWSGQLKPRLQPGEIVLAWCEPDLDHDLRFAETLVVVTSARVLSLAPPPSSGHVSAATRLPHFKRGRWRTLLR